MNSGKQVQLSQKMHKFAVDSSNVARTQEIANYTPKNI